MSAAALLDAWRRCAPVLRAALAGACGLWLIGVAPVARQAGPRTFRTGVNVVRVDVFPTRDGTLVRGLTAADFSIAEDDVPQRIDSCVFVDAQRGPTAPRRDPATVERAAAATAASGSGRLFVVFLDTHHVNPGSSARVRQGLMALLRQVLGAEDLVAVATPESSAADLTLSRGVDALDAMLERRWAWGRRQRTTDVEAAEAGYSWCYPEQAPEERCSGGGQSYTQAPDFYSGVAREMVERRRERQTLDALEDVTTWAGGIREDRKAVVVISEGWRLFRPDDALTRRSPCAAAEETAGNRGRRAQPGRPSARVAPSDFQACERDRAVLAALDNARLFRDVADRANRVNVSFYTIDPRGLAVFDTTMAETRTSGGGVTQPLLTPSASSARLGERLDALRGLAASTDGIAAVGAGDLARGIARIGDDMAGYYLLSYASTNTRLDGKFRRIAVAVKGDRVEIRARRGYLAPTAAEVAAAGATERPGPAGAPPPRRASAVSEALAALESAAPDLPLRVGVAWLAPSGTTAGFMTVVSELEPALARTGGAFSAGGYIDMVAEDEHGRIVAERRVTLVGGERHATVAIPLPAGSPGSLAVRVRATPGAGGLPLADAIRVRLEGADAAVGTPHRFRRGAAAASPWLPTSDLAFGRVETLRVDVPIREAAEPATGALLDRNGSPLAVPVACLVVPREADGPAWARCEVRLAPLAPAAYVLRLTLPATATGGTRDVLAPFRVR